MINYFINNMGYSITMIAKILKRSDNYVSGAMTKSKIAPECEIVSDAGPFASGWSGETLNKLVEEKILSAKLPQGTIIWKSGRKPKNAATSIYDSSGE